MRQPDLQISPGKKNNNLITPSTEEVSQMKSHSFEEINSPSPLRKYSNFSVNLHSKKHKNSLQLTKLNTINYPNYDQDNFDEIQSANVTKSLNSNTKRNSLRRNIFKNFKNQQQNKFQMHPLEEKINHWLDEQGVYQVRPDPQNEYYQMVKSQYFDSSVRSSFSDNNCSFTEAVYQLEENTDQTNQYELDQQEIDSLNNKQDKLITLNSKLSMHSFTDEKMSSFVNIENSERDAIFKKLKTQGINDRCFECDKKNTKWASVNLGLYLCFDCSGKHRSFGPKLSLVRSLDLDVWNTRYITFMENGGNQKFLDYMKKNGALQGNSRVLDWENNAHIKKYKADLGKIVDNIMAKQNSSTQEQQQQQQPFEDKKQQNEEQEQEQKLQQNVFNNNLTSNKSGVTKTTTNVVFASKKTSQGQQVGNKKLKAEKIDDFDWDQMTFDDGVDKKNDGKQTSSKNSGESNNNKLMDFKLYEEEEAEKTQNQKQNGFGGGNQNSFSSSSNNNNKQQANFDKFKNENAKSISSASFFQAPEGSAQEKQKFNNFQGSQAISSDMFFERKASEENSASNHVDNFKNFIWGVKEKTQDYISKQRENWK